MKKIISIWLSLVRDWLKTFSQVRRIEASDWRAWWVPQHLSSKLLVTPRTAAQKYVEYHMALCDDEQLLCKIVPRLAFWCIAVYYESERFNKTVLIKE
ncbi:hypothetical protein E2C01_074265 [Portunus trituberculatus]|uniref:Uncharacterized protein n=1 Tax=Portunus trituberculatus TaxID=210409 RepID=A0A5B7I7L1_PORTR|nr:hypothetical protein [Portunus trituberculatus]